MPVTHPLIKFFFTGFNNADVINPRYNILTVVRGRLRTVVRVVFVIGVVFPFSPVGVVGRSFPLRGGPSVVVGVGVAGEPDGLRGLGRRVARVSDDGLAVAVVAKELVSLVRVSVSRVSVSRVSLSRVSLSRVSRVSSGVSGVGSRVSVSRVWLVSRVASSRDRDVRVVLGGSAGHKGCDDGENFHSVVDSGVDSC